MNNGYLGMIRQWQGFSTTRTLSRPRLRSLTSARSSGLRHQGLAGRTQVGRASRHSGSARAPWPCVDRLHDRPEENVWPMVPGRSSPLRHP
ncbi:MAG: hypothetical protein R3B97_14990 [Dehalococcoidia bacterium]